MESIKYFRKIRKIENFEGKVKKNIGRIEY